MQNLNSKGKNVMNSSHLEKFAIKSTPLLKRWKHSSKLENNAQISQQIAYCAHTYKMKN